MKRKVSVILGICILMLIALSSCSLDDLQGNLYEKMGLIDIENPSAQKVSELVDSIETAKQEKGKEWVSVEGDQQTLNVANIEGFKDIADAIESIGKDSGTVTEDLKITIDSGTAKLITENGILKPQDKEKEELYASLGSALGSTSGTKNLVDSMSQEAPQEQSDAAKGTMALTNSLISQITNSMGGNGEESEMPAEIKEVLDTLKEELASKSKQTESLSKAEVLQVQMVTNLVSSVANAANVLKENENEDMSELMKKDEVIAIMDDLTLLSNVTNALSVSTSVLSIPNISELIQSFTNSSNGDGSQEVQA